MAITKTNRLNMTGGGIPLIVRLSQYDDDFTLIFELYSTDGTFTIPSGTTAEVRGTKSDGKGFSASATLDITNKKVTVTGDQQMTAVPGKHIFELTLWKSNKELNSANFILDVEPAALDRNTIVSESKIMELLDVTDRADEIIEAAETIESSAAQIAKNTQDIAVIEEEIAHIGSGFPDAAKIALLNCFAHVAWIDEHGQDYYDALEAALYADAYPKITAVFDAGLNVIYTDDALDTLKQYLTVKYYEAEGSTAVIVPSTDYTLFGTLSEGSNTLRATYEGLSAPFDVDGVVDFYNIFEWAYPGNLDMYKGTPSFLSGSDTDGVWFRNSSAYINNKRTVFVNKGKLAVVEEVAVTGDIFPIPIPSAATSVSATINPSTMQVLLQRWVLHGDVYKLDGISSWQTGTATLNFSSASDAFICVNIRYNSQQAVFPTEPQGFEMTFE